MPSTAVTACCSLKITSCALLPAFVERLEIDLDPSAVEGRVDAVHSDKGGQARDGRIREDGGSQRLLALDHGGEGNRLRRLRNAEEHAGVLHGEEPLRDGDVQYNCDHEGEDRHGQRRRLVIEHPAEGPPIGGDRPIKDGLRPSIKRVLLRVVSVAEQAGAHHRRQGQ